MQYSKVENWVTITFPVSLTVHSHFNLIAFAIEVHVSNVVVFSSLLLLRENTMATSQLSTDTKKFDEKIVDVITDLRRKQACRMRKNR